MPSPAFLRAFAFTCSSKIEGGFVKDADDKGCWTGGAVGVGELRGTKFGISAAAYPALDIESIRPEQARDIYFADYWQKAGCESLPPRLALVHFDSAVNVGVDRAIKLLQQALDVAPDGKVGPHTVAAARVLDQTESCVALLAERAMFYAGAKTYAKYGRGWMRRVMRCAMEVGR